jgi:hypothetical protein
VKYRLQLQRRWTNSIKELIAEVDQIKKALKPYELLPVGYDPGVLVTDARNPQATPFDMPIWFLERLMERQED